MEKENFIQSILQSGASIQKVTPEDTLFDKINSRIIKEEKVSKSTFWWVAASILLLISINAIIVLNNKKQEKETSFEGIISGSNNQLYN